MGYDRKYGQVTTERGTIGDDEPVFVIRGADKSAPNAIRAYASNAAICGADDDMIANVRERANQVAAWQAEHPDLVKVPTTVPGQIIDA